MTRVEQILEDIDQLTLEERAELARRMHGWEDDEWDRQMAQDAAEGKLDHLIERAKEDARCGRVRELP